MKLSPVPILMAGLATAYSSIPLDNVWKAPLPTDRRSPCPMVNTLANHGFLPRNGLNVSMDDLITGFNASVNLEAAATQLVGAKALTASTTGDPNTFNLDDLDKHGIIEHDGSLSRADIYFGDNHSFNSTIFDSVVAYFTNETISINTAATAHKARLATAAATNPTFNMSATDMQFSFLESALYLTVFGEGTPENVPTDWVVSFFREERLPYELGWKRPAEQLTGDNLLATANQIAAVP